MTTNTSTYSDQSGLKNTVSMLAVVTLLTGALVGRAQATVFSFENMLTGLQEVPPNASTAIGEITGTYDDVTNMFDFSVVFVGLLSPTTQAHLHAPAPPGVNAPIVIGFVGFPVGVFSGSYSNTYVFTPQREIELLAGLMYVNIHTNLFPGGEIRGQILPIPEPATGIFLGLGTAWLVAFARRSRRSRATSAR